MIELGCFATNALTVTVEGPMEERAGLSVHWDCHYITIDNVDGGAIVLDGFDRPDGPSTG